jgi:hypothetical protein
MKFKVPKGVTSVSLQGIECEIKKGFIEAEIEVEFLLAQGFTIVEDASQTAAQDLTADVEANQTDLNTPAGDDTSVDDKA